MDANVGAQVDIEACLTCHAYEVGAVAFCLPTCAERPGRWAFQSPPKIIATVAFKVNHLASIDTRYSKLRLDWEQHGPYQDITSCCIPRHFFLFQIPKDVLTWCTMSLWIYHYNILPPPAILKFLLAIPHPLAFLDPASPSLLIYIVPIYSHCFDHLGR